MNDYLKFEDQLLSKLQQRYPELEFIKFLVKKVDRSYKSVSVNSKYKDTIKVSCQIDLDYWYEEFINKKLGIDRILDLIGSQIKHFERDSLILKQKVKEINDFDKIKDKIFARVVNCKKTKGMKDLAVYEVEDLDCLFYIDVDQNYMFHITKPMVEMWQTNIDDLRRIALTNLMKKYQLKISPIEEVLFGIIGEMESGIEVPLYVCLLNKKGYPYPYSAVMMVLAPELLKPCLDGDYYIIPSSEHELLLIRDGVCTISEIRAIIKDTNKYILREEDILSDNLYKYDMKNKRLKMV